MKTATTDVKENVGLGEIYERPVLLNSNPHCPFGTKTVHCLISLKGLY